MSNSRQLKIDILAKHANNLRNSKTFEEYRDMHVKYIECLIESIKTEKWEWREKKHDNE